MTHLSSSKVIWLSALAIMLCGLGIPTPSSAETWTNLRGTNSVEAEMVGLWGNQLVLDLGDGRRIAVSLDDLRAESRIQARQLANSKNEAREARIGELKTQAALAAASAPDPLPQPPPADPYVMPNATDEVAVNFTAIDQQLRAGHLLAIFDALPPSYQKDLDELVKLAAIKVSGITWQSLVDSVRQLGDVIVTKQNWFFSHPRFDVSKSPAPEQAARLNETILSLANVLRSGMEAEDFDPATMQTTPLREWLAKRDAAIAPHVAVLFRQSNTAPPQFGVEKGKGKDVSLTISMTSAEADQPVTKLVPMTKIDQVLVPASIADAWKNTIPPKRKTLEAAADGSLLADSTSVVLLSAVAPLVSSLQQAQTRNDFHAAMQPLLDIAVPLLETLKKNLESGF